MIKDNQFFNNGKDSDKKEIKNNENKNEKNSLQDITGENDKYFKEEKDLENDEDSKGIEDSEDDEDLEDDFDEDDEDENSKKNIFKEKLIGLIEICKNNKKRVIIVSIIIAVICIGVTTVVLLGKNGKTSGAGAQLPTTKNEYVDVIPAEVGDIDDPNDPQLQNGNDSEGTGAQMSATDMKKTSSMSNGIDLSKFQGKVDWDAVAATKKIDFAMIRVGYRTDNNGTIVEDPYARYNMQMADEAGIKVGVYFFSTATTKEEALEEAAWTTNTIAKYKITYPVVYNCEGFTKSDSRMYGISNANRTDYAIAFLNYVKNEGYEPMLYANKTDLDNSTYWDTKKISASYKIWVAQYPDQLTEKSSYTGTNAMWQYTCNGKVTGINGFVDMNIAYFYYENAVEPKDTSGAANADNPELGVTFTAASGQRTAKENTNLRSLPNTMGDILANIKNGEFATLISNGDNGWSKLEFNGITGYSLTRLLTDKANAVAVPVTPAETKAAEVSAYTDVSDQVTAKEETNLRKEANTTSALVATITNGTFYTRTGIGKGNNEWSRLVYNGETVYAKTDLLTTEVKVTQAPTTSAEGEKYKVQNMVFTAISDKVTITSNVQSVNLRDLPSTTVGETKATLKTGEFIERTGLNEGTGWSKLIYNGTTVYAVTQYLKN